MIRKMWFFLGEQGDKEVTLNFTGYELKEIYNGLRVMNSLSQFEQENNTAINKIRALNEEDFKYKKIENENYEIKSKVKRIMEIMKE